ncbi:UvrD-helicase domain-containing protein [Sphingomonas sp. RB1R13]|uniref:UvrD-helicase domain-containing protein n=1 Tax=Sphingomonas sp. RB1R13 TaxID=3096159 RepID=UPI002FC7B2C4
MASDHGITALITYTRSNVREIQLKAYERVAAIPSHIEVLSWYTFLLRELARPYRSAMHKRRIEGIHWVEGTSAQFVPEFKTSAHYFLGGERIYSDKIAKFICECDRKSGGAIMRRLKQRFSHIIIDEVQDMAGYDLDVLELILKSDIPVTLVGDHRQAILSTNNSPKHKKFAGPAIIRKFEIWKTAGLVSIEYETHTHRCNQAIADLGDSFFPNEPKTVSRNDVITDHDGVFLVASADVDEYVKHFSPQVLRHNVKTLCGPHDALNFGEAKGLTFPRVLIFPHGGAKSWLASGKLSFVEKSAARMYVAATRARYSVAFVFDGKTCAIPAIRWTP